MHLAAAWSAGVNIVKYLLREHKEICTPMLLVDKRGTPLEYAESIKVSGDITNLSSALYLSV